MNRNVEASVSAQLRVIAHPPEGWNVLKLYDELVHAGNDPKKMIIQDNYVIVYQTENWDG